MIRFNKNYVTSLRKLQKNGVYSVGYIVYFPFALLFASVFVMKQLRLRFTLHNIAYKKKRYVVWQYSSCFISMQSSLSVNCKYTHQISFLKHNIFWDVGGLCAKEKNVRRVIFQHKKNFIYTFSRLTFRFIFI